MSDNFRLRNNLCKPKIHKKNSGQARVLVKIETCQVLIIVPESFIRETKYLSTKYLRMLLTQLNETAAYTIPLPQSALLFRCGRESNTVRISVHLIQSSFSAIQQHKLGLARPTKIHVATA